MDNIWMIILIVILVLVVAGVAVIVIRRLLSRRKEEQTGKYWYYQDQWLLNAFDNFDVGVYGLRGMGKDVIFAHSINLKGTKHYSNIRYNENTEVRDLKDLNVGGNTYEMFIEGKTHMFEPNFDEGHHFFISDAGVYLGCQFNKELNQNYGELPIHMALRRHLYNSHVHTNSQALNRPWDKLREQQGIFIHALGVTNCGDHLIVRAISYTKYESALECMPPPAKPNAQYTMKHGEILEHKFKVPVSTLIYDTRHFKTKLLLLKEDSNGSKRAKIII